MFDNPRIEESPKRMPGYCRGCRAGSLTREWIMDLDIDDEDHPGYAIQLCNYCFQRLAELAGYQKFDLLLSMNTERIEELEKENEQLHRVDSILGLLGLDTERLIRVGILAGLLDSEAESSDGDTPEGFGPGETVPTGTGGSKSEGTASVRIKRQKRTIESSHDENLGTIRSGSDDDEPAGIGGTEI